MPYQLTQLDHYSTVMPLLGYIASVIKAGEHLEQNHSLQRKDKDGEGERTVYWRRRRSNAYLLSSNIL